jgi:3-phenylpropionate/cinnamic acid dioxygenase small subunit
MLLPGFEPAPVAAALARELRAEIEMFHTEYCAALDEGRIADWPAFFTEDAVYRITARENADAKLPVGLVYCEGMGMLRDRAFAIAKTAMFAPRHLLHLVGNIRVLSAAADVVTAQSNYMVLQTLVEERTTIHQAGRYFDRFRRGDGALRLLERHCVYESPIIDNALILPV